MVRATLADNKKGSAMDRARKLALLLSIAALCPAPVRANDSAAEIGIGGLTLTRSEVVRLDSEELTVSRDRVAVSYRFTNSSARDVETLVAFPLPDQSFGIEIPVVDFAEQLAFSTTVDGEPVPLDVLVRAHFDGRDIAQRLEDLGLPVIPVHDRFDKAVNAMPEAARKTLVTEGLIVDDGSDGVQQLWAAKWTLKTTATRKQIFPAGKTIRVEHAYKPYVGGSVGGYLDPRYRKEQEFSSKRKRWCIDGAFLRALDRRMAEGRKASTNFVYSEVWLAYVLTSGANWAGPIRDFRLVVDKGNPDSLVSFCGDGLKKLDATHFELRKKNFTPTTDLNVLIIDFHKT
jgi:hypothetical protein